MWSDCATSRIISVQQKDDFRESTDQHTLLPFRESHSHQCHGIESGLNDAQRIKKPSTKTTDMPLQQCRYTVRDLFEPARETISRLRIINGAADIRDQSASLIMDGNDNPAMHRAGSRVEPDTKALSKQGLDAAPFQIRMMELNWPKPESNSGLVVTSC